MAPLSHDRRSGGDGAARAAEVDPRAASTTQLVAGIVEDTRDLLGAHVDTLRGDLQGGLDELKRIVAFVAVATTVGIVGALLVCLAIAATLVALGLPTWAAMWIVAGAALVGTIVLGLSARARARRATVVPKQAAEEAADDARWVAARTRDAVTGGTP